MKMLHIKKGHWIDTETGHQEVISQYGDTSYIVHNFDENDQYTGASYLTDREILKRYHEQTGKVFDFVILDT